MFILGIFYLLLWRWPLATPIQDQDPPRWGSLPAGSRAWERAMKERDRLTRHSNITLIWHDTENTKTACIRLALRSHDVSVLESITVSERLANQRRESAARQRTRRTTTNEWTRAANEVSSFTLKSRSFELIRSRTSSTLVSSTFVQEKNNISNKVKYTFSLK